MGRGHGGPGGTNSTTPSDPNQCILEALWGRKGQSLSNPPKKRKFGINKVRKFYLIIIINRYTAKLYYTCCITL